MRYLEELEQKVLRLIEKNQELKKQLAVSTDEIRLMQDQARQFEASLLKEVTASNVLAQEKAAIIKGIEELIASLNALENMQ